MNDVLIDINNRILAQIKISIDNLKQITKKSESTKEELYKEIVDELSVEIAQITLNYINGILEVYDGECEEEDKYFIDELEILKKKVLEYLGE